MKKKTQRGGARKGAGRKAKEETKVIRVPVSKMEAIEKLLRRKNKKDQYRVKIKKLVITHPERKKK